ncbi:hypothetical protein CONPUDRAFT_156651 [Coniophora puteana RWD-64-598 SS2]|uniref:Uncharacterized protein n=1 Tax=Coniophora puteana (strain RWD-64-598) TaxID=741705 RepID=A0A5M3MIE4_CONPW|nr:uncharacterized protein CONPUDRAFT_156651 [Coniophora puteana RWD-64-598 SS2]EIW78690.1 hypothetical protein CONPUDRAFT_156651 [Coniophora puteana RWD-64-598 SS2]
MAGWKEVGERRNLPAQTTTRVEGVTRLSAPLHIASVRLATYHTKTKSVVPR